MSSITTTIDRVADAMRAMFEFSDRQVLVGIPADRAARRTAAGGITNAQLGYIHEKGAPEASIPARPWLVPTVRADRDMIAQELGEAGRAALAGKSGEMQARLERIGQRVADDARKRIAAGIPPPLAASTLRGRIRRRTSIKAAQAELASRAAGNLPGVDLAKPLIATAQMYRSITYVVRSRTAALNLVVGGKPRR